MLKGFRLNRKALSLALIVLLAGCGSGNSGNFVGDFFVRNFTYVDFDKKNLVDQVGKNVIIPEYNNFYTSSVKLENKINSFVSNPTETSLRETQNLWKEVMSSWQKTQVYQFGPVKDLNIATKIYFWPSKSEAVEEVLAKASNTLTDNYLGTVGVTKKGLPVIEYLIFDNVNGNTKILEAFKDETKSATRKRYLQLLAKDLSNNAQQINNQWSINQGNYLNKLEAESNAFNMLVNNMIAIVEDIRDKKIAAPLGKRSADGGIRPEEVESLQSGNAKTNIINNLASLKQVFNGSDKADSKDIGLDDYLEYVEKTALRDQINNQIDKASKSITAINKNLDIAVDKDPQRVETAYNEMTELLRLIKVDMANAVNETVNFNSSDGD